MSNKIMKTLTMNGITYDIVDGKVEDNLRILNNRLTSIDSLIPANSTAQLVERKIGGEINEDKITTIGIYAFAGCSNLTSVSFPACTTIGNSAFSGCSNLTSVEFPVCTSIGERAFYSCSSLTSVNFPVCTSIGNYAFQGCRSLTSVNLPVCTTIGGFAFYRCSSLTSVSFPVCATIGGSAFYSCSSLTSITIAYSSVCTLLVSNAFYYTPMSDSTYTGAFGSIYVPASLVDAYKTATNWSYYSSRITSIIT